MQPELELRKRIHHIHQREVCVLNRIINLVFNFTFPGNKTAKKVFLNILSKEDGKEDIVRAAKKFCTSVDNQECKPKSMSVKYFSNILEGNYMEFV